MSEKIKIVEGDGYALINAGDYNDKIHQLYIEPEKPIVEPVKKEVKPKPVKKTKGKS